MKSPIVILAATLAVTALSPGNLLAATAAYWRHEETTPVGAIIPDGPDTVLDSSGNGNHMQTFASSFEPFTAATYSSIVSPLALRSGLPNTKSLDFGPMPAIGTEDGGDPLTNMGRNDDNFTANDKPIEEQLFTAMTVELSFRMNTVGGFQALFGKDGKPLGDMIPPEDDSPVPPLKIMVRGDDFPGAVPNQLFVEWIDGDGTFAGIADPNISDVHFLASGETVVPDVWYHVAFTLTATDAELWVAGETGDYVLKDALSGQDFVDEVSESVLVIDPTPLTIGRGMFDNGVADWADAIIDEVRVSDTALTPNEFLFVAAPGGNNADFDGDQDVDGNDFLIWQRGLGLPGASQTSGDANNDQVVNADDLGVWKSQFGDSAIGAVPEPSTVLLCALVLAATAGRTRSRAW